MRILREAAHHQEPAQQFTGDVWLDLLATPEEGDQRMVVGLVRFAPGARSAWHRHARGPTLHVLSGVALVTAPHPKTEQATSRTDESRDGPRVSGFAAPDVVRRRPQRRYPG